MFNELSLFQDYIKTRFNLRSSNRNRNNIIFLNTDNYLSNDDNITKILKSIILQENNELFFIEYSYRNSDFYNAFDPFISIIKNKISTIPIKKFKNYCKGIYFFHKSLLENYFLFNKFKRNEEIINFKAEIQFERKMINDSIWKLFCNLFHDKTNIIILKNFNYASYSIINFIKYIIENKLIPQNVFIIIFYNRVDNHNIFNDFIEYIQNKYEILFLSTLQGKSKQSYEEDKLDLNSKLNYIRTNMYFLAFEDAKRQINNIYYEYQKNKNNFTNDEAIFIFMTLGDVYSYLEDYDNAIIYFNQLLTLLSEKKLTKNLFDIYRKMSHIYWEKGSNIEANNFAKKALQVDITNIESEDLYKFYLVEFLSEFFFFYDSSDSQKHKIDKWFKIEEYLEMNKKYNTLTILLTNVPYIMAIAKNYNYETAIQKCNKGIALSLKYKNLYRISTAYHSIAMVYQYHGEYEKAFKSYTKCANIRKKLGNKLEEVKIYNGIGYFSTTMENYKNALNYYYKAFKILENISEYQETCLTLFNIAYIFFYTSNYENCVQYLNYVLCIMSQLEMEEIPFHSKLQIYSMIGICYIKSKNFNKLSFIINQINNNLKYQNIEAMAYYYLFMALYNNYQNLNDRAINYFDKVNDILSKNNFGSMGPFVMIENALFYKNFGNLEKFKYYLNNGLEYTKYGAYPYQKQRILDLMNNLDDNKNSIKINFKKININSVIEKTKQQSNLHKLHKKINEMNFINSLSNIITNSIERNELLSKCLYLIKNTYIVDWLVFINVNKHTNTINFEYSLKNLNIDVSKFEDLFEILLKKEDNLFYKDARGIFNYSERDDIQSLIKMTITQSENINNVLILISFNSENRFNIDDYSVINIAMNQIKLALERIQLIEKQKEQIEYINKINLDLEKRNKQLTNELEMARRVQENMILSCNNIDINKKLYFASKYVAMESIGGDLFDIIKISDNKIGILMADVSGHGVPAALITAMAKVLFNSYSNPNLSSSDILTLVNKDIYKLIGDLEYYITAYFGIIDTDKNIFEYSTAGHNPALFLPKETNEIIELKTKGLPIGVFEDTNYEKNAINLKSGDKIFFYTDGITEAKNEDGIIYDTNRLKSFMLSYRNMEISEFIDKLFDDVNKFCGDAKQDDDRAILYVEYYEDEKTKKNSVKFETRIQSQIKK